jgi:hypothetical protein
VRRSATPSTAAAGDSTLSTESKMEDAPSVRE